MSDNSSKITHKELLTFSNLTNLEWKFADINLDNNEENEDFETTSEEYKPLIDLLSSPEIFNRQENEDEKNKEAENTVAADDDEDNVEYIRLKK